jgi:hypothetical protein
MLFLLKISLKSFNYCAVAEPVEDPVVLEPPVEEPVLVELPPLWVGAAPPKPPPKEGFTIIVAAMEELLVEGMTITLSPLAIELILADWPADVILVEEVMLYVFDVPVRGLSIVIDEEVTALTVPKPPPPLRKPPPLVLGAVVLLPLLTNDLV